MATVLAALTACAALVLAACAPNPVAPEADGDWVLVSGHGPEGEIDMVEGHQPSLTVDGTEVSGHTGCNHFGMAEEDAQPEEWPTEFVSTMMACAPPEVMDQEVAFLAAMRQITEVQAGDDELVLSGPDTELRFERAIV